ncbi:hypothetical protein NitYY0826_C1912 [Nitratiruptor sp. YY08-26]|uniref:hypothetical protein n=1 Tax=unclassified Nitratiruptor TaxID=2624044 RepID=UPI001916597E|nr:MULTISPECIES: hypothetical protein [unclassified Nitratiruptor]BCD63022.1 hypothetical protein NitYY0813_C1910 [Nitratiruptor sp. YY08-13]BCD66957.1 hypothetical protein NitYY0826_C1912 [Nitratiruptor sp. YY08-26]
MSNFKKHLIKQIEEVKKPRIHKIKELLFQIDRLRAEVEAQKQELRSDLALLFEDIESQIENLPENERQEALRTLHECKLHSLEFLGILAETVESAILNALENGENIEETITEITKDLAFETININVDPTHIKNTSTTIIQVAANIAEASINHADEIIKGAIYGTKQGIHKSLAKFNETVEFTPDEARSLIIENYETIIQNLPHIDEIFYKSIEEVAQKSEPGIKEKILQIAEQPIYDKLLTEAQKAVIGLKKSFNELLKEAPSIKISADEAKKMGKRAFEIAKEKIQESIHAIKK